MTNIHHTVLYTGVSNNLDRRVAEHRQSNARTFTGKYRITQLVYYETFNSIIEAIAREKAIKGGSRAKKVHLITTLNPEWRDLASVRQDEVASSVPSPHLSVPPRNDER